MIVNGTFEALLSIASNIKKFSSIDDIINNLGNVKELKHGEIQGTIDVKNMDRVFFNLAKRYKAKVSYTPNGNPYFSANGYRVQMYNSTSGAGNSIQINSGQQIYKIRLAKNLTK